MKNIIYKTVLSVLFFSVSFCGICQSEADYKKITKEYTLFPDGSQEFKYGMELTIYTHTAMNNTYGESFIVYNPEFQELKINNSYTKQKDGTIIKTPENAFVEVLPRNAANMPAFNHLKEMVVVHTGLELGATIYLDYTIYSKPGYCNEIDIFDIIQETSPVKELNYSISFPQSKDLKWDVNGVKGTQSTSNGNGLKTFKWTFKNIPASPKTNLSSVSNGDIPFITATTYSSESASLAVIKNELKANDLNYLNEVCQSITKDSETDFEKLNSIINYTKDNIDFCGVSFGETGFRLRPADDIIKTSYGTQFEKTNLLFWLLKVAGFDGEVGAVYHVPGKTKAMGNRCVSDLFIKTRVDGKTYLLDPDSPKMAKSGWEFDRLPVLSVSSSGNKMELPVFSPIIKQTSHMIFSDGVAETKTTATLSNSFLPYFGEPYFSFGLGAFEELVEKTDNVTTAVFTNHKNLVDENGYHYIKFDDSPFGISKMGYSILNKDLNINISLPYMVDETYNYTVDLGDNVDFIGKEYERIVDNKVGKLIIKVEEDNNKVRFTRQLKLKTREINLSEYSHFRELMINWNNESDRILVFSKR